MFDPHEPQTMNELAQALDAMTTQGRAFLDALSAAAFFAPQAAKWSPAEHVRHLRKSSAPLVTALRLPAWLLRLRFGAPPAGSRTYSRLRDDYHAALAAGAQAGRFAPRREDAPADPEARRREILEAWQATNVALAGRMLAWSEGQADRACLPHPALGPLTVREMAAFTVFHTVHHLELVRARLSGA